MAVHFSPISDARRSRGEKRTVWVPNSPTARGRAAGVGTMAPSPRRDAAASLPSAVDVPYAATADIGAARLYSSAASRRQSIITAIGPTGSGWNTAPIRR